MKEWYGNLSEHFFEVFKLFWFACFNIWRIDYRRGYKKSSNFLALHVNHERAAIEMRRDGLWEEISTEILGEDVTNTGKVFFQGAEL